MGLGGVSRTGALKGGAAWVWAASDEFSWQPTTQHSSSYYPWCVRCFVLLNRYWGIATGPCFPYSLSPFFLTPFGGETPTQSLTTGHRKPDLVTYSLGHQHLSWITTGGGDQT